MSDPEASAHVPVTGLLPPGGGPTRRPRRRRRALGVAIPLVLYFVLRAVVGASEAGLITPEGALDLGLAAAGATTLALRLWALFILPGVVLFWFAGALAEKLEARRRAGRRTP